METLLITPLETDDQAIEIVERKGLGHPDTICDALAEVLSRNLCREYRSRFGEILHHNVDKALLCGGQAMAEFGGGRVLAPIEIYLAGRAISEVGNVALPISEIAIEGSRCSHGGRDMKVLSPTTRRSVSATPRLARWNSSFSRSKGASMEETVPTSIGHGVKTSRSWASATAGWSI